MPARKKQKDGKEDETKFVATPIRLKIDGAASEGQDPPSADENKDPVTLGLHGDEAEAVFEALHNEESLEETVPKDSDEDTEESLDATEEANPKVDIVNLLTEKLEAITARLDQYGLSQTEEFHRLNQTVSDQGLTLQSIQEGNWTLPSSVQPSFTRPAPDPSRPKSSTFMNRSYAGVAKNLSSGELYSPDTRRNVNRMDISNSVLKSWQQVKLGNDVLGFPEWHRKAVSYLTSVGLVAMVWYDPFKVPITIKDWEGLAEASFTSSRNKDMYDKIYDRAACGHDYSDLLDKKDMGQVNLAFAATINARPGLNSSIATALESTLDLTELDSVLLDTEESASIYSSRLLFFRIYQHFMLNTENSRLERLQFVTSELVPTEGQSLRAFAKRLKQEVRVLNMMSEQELVNETLMLSRFKLLTRELYGENPRYEIELSLLTQKKPKYSLDDLVDIWEPVWLERQTNEGSHHATALFTRHKGGHNKQGQRSKKHSGAGKKGRNGKDKYKNKVYNMSDSDVRKEKKKLSKDKDGKLLCWQFLKDGDCSFGKECKFSHKPQGNKVFVVFSPEEIQQNVVDQVIMYANQQRHKVKKFKKKFKHSNTQKSYTANDDSGKRTIEGAIRNHKKRMEAQNTEKTNVAHDESKHSDSQESSLTESSPDDSSSTIDSSGSEEFSGMIRHDSESECISNDVAYLDSGATVHLCGDKRKFKTYRKCSVRILCANNQYMYAEGIGDIHITLGGQIVVLKDVLHLKGAPNLISTSKLVDSGELLVVVSKGRCDIVNASTDEVLYTSKVTSKKKLYEIPLECDYTESVNIADANFDAESWVLANEPYVGTEAHSVSKENVIATDSSADVLKVENSPDDSTEAKDSL